MRRGKWIGSMSMFCFLFCNKMLILSEFSLYFPRLKGLGRSPARPPRARASPALRCDDTNQSAVTLLTFPNGFAYCSGSLLSRFLSKWPRFGRRLRVGTTLIIYLRTSSLSLSTVHERGGRCPPAAAAPRPHTCMYHGYTIVTYSVFLKCDFLCDCRYSRPAPAQRLSAPAHRITRHTLSNTDTHLFNSF